MNNKKGRSTVSLQKEYEVRRRQFSYDNLQEHTVAVVGLGYVGLPLALTVAEKGIPVVGYDTDSTKIDKLKSGEADFISPEEQLTFKNNMMDVDSHYSILRGADTFFVCVPTPVTADHMPDLGPLIDATRAVAAALRPGSIVLVESTINPGICDDILIPILEFESDLSVERDFYFAYCPERINPGDDRFNTKNIPRVLGAAGPHSLERGLKIYRSILESEITPMGSLKEAEAVKMVENAFRDVNIAFVNELAMAFDREGIDVVNVINGAATKPFGFMAHYPGCGVGGHCIPVDPYYLIEYGRKHGFTHHLLMSARTTNNHMPHYTIKLLREAMYFGECDMGNTPVTLLGLSYKRGIGDMRESPAIEINDLLVQEGAKVRTFDP
ncbi:MAG TPA: nucleotide sugar dehydrogenase, partial [Candidatus Paceibacterota bacterium]